MFESSYDFLIEEVAWTDNINRHIAECIPLTPTVVKLIFDNKRTTAFHITDAQHYTDMALLEKKKSLSCFTYCTEKKLTDTKITTHTKGGVIYQLEGNLLFSLNKDSMSKPDPSGRRWILSQNFPSKFRTELNNWLWSNENKDWSFLKTKNEWFAFLKKYIPFIEELVKKYAQDIRRLCDMYWGYQDPSTTEQDEDDYNEVVLNNIKVKDILVNKKVILEYEEENNIPKIIDALEKTFNTNVELVEDGQSILRWFHERGGITDYSALIKGKEHYGDEFW